MVMVDYYAIQFIGYLRTFASERSNRVCWEAIAWSIMEL